MNQWTSWHTRTNRFVSIEYSKSPCSFARASKFKPIARYIYKRKRYYLLCPTWSCSRDAVSSLCSVSASADRCCLRGGAWAVLNCEKDTWLPTTPQHSPYYKLEVALGGAIACRLSDPTRLVPYVSFSRVALQVAWRQLAVASSYWGRDCNLWTVTILSRILSCFEMVFYALGDKWRVSHYLEVGPECNNLLVYRHDNIPSELRLGFELFFEEFRGLKCLSKGKLCIWCCRSTIRVWHGGTCIPCTLELTILAILMHFLSRRVCRTSWTTARVFSQF